MRNRYAAESSTWYSHQDVRTGSKVGGKKKAHTAFYDKKRAISNGKKRETTDRRREQHSIE